MYFYLIQPVHHQFYIWFSSFINRENPIQIFTSYFMALVHFLTNCPKNKPMMKQNHLPFLITSFIQQPSAAVIPKPMTNIKMYLKLLQWSNRKPKRPSGSSGKVFLKASSTIPIQRLGTKCQRKLNYIKVYLNLTKKQFQRMTKPELYSPQKSLIVWSKVSKEVEAANNLLIFNKYKHEKYLC